MRLIDNDPIIQLINLTYGAARDGRRRSINKPVLTININIIKFSARISVAVMGLNWTSYVLSAKEREQYISASSGMIVEAQE